MKKCIWFFVILISSLGSASAALVVSGTIRNIQVNDDATFLLNIGTDGGGGTCGASGWYTCKLASYPSANAQMIYNGQLSLAMFAASTGTKVLLYGANTCSSDKTYTVLQTIIVPE